MFKLHVNAVNQNEPMPWSMPERSDTKDHRLSIRKFAVITRLKLLPRITYYDLLSCLLNGYTPIKWHIIYVFH